MCKLVYYVNKSDIDLCFDSIKLLSTIQKCENIEIQYIDKFEQLCNRITQDFPYIGEKGYFSLQMISQELTMPVQMSINYLGINYRKDNSEMKMRQYEQMIKKFILLSDNSERFSMLRKIESDINDDRDIYKRIYKLENCFVNCYGYEIPQDSKGQMATGILAMEKKLKSEAQVIRRNAADMNTLHFYQVIWFAEDESVIWGKSNIQKLISLNKNLVTYQFAMQGDCLIKYDIREFYAVDSRGLDVLIQAHKDRKISDESLVLHVTEEGIADCLSLKLMIENEQPLTQGNSTCRGAASGRVIFGNESLENLRQKKDNYILVKNDLTPMDIEYIYLSDGIITGKCSSTSHQAIIAKQLGKVFVFACQDFEMKGDLININGISLSHDSELSIDGGKGYVYYGKKELQENYSAKENLKYFMNICNKYKNIGIMTNTESLYNFEVFESNWSEGIGLYRTEYMHPQHKIKRLLQESVLATNYETRMGLVKELQSVWETELSKIFYAVGNKKIIVRTLDYPSQELFYDMSDELSHIATDIQMPIERVEYNIFQLREENGMLGNRGSRFSVSFPEIFEAQIHSIFRAYNAIIDKKKPVLKLMFPMISHLSELKWMKEKVEKVVAQNPKYQDIDYKLGIMIETPRAIMIIAQLAKLIDFMSFGTNDLTQLVWGMSREDHYKIINRYKQNGLIDYNPYEKLDEEAVAPLIDYVIKKVREINHGVEIGICGAQAFESEKLLCNMGVDYISINSEDIPYAVLLAAQIAIMEMGKK